MQTGVGGSGHFRDKPYRDHICSIGDTYEDFGCGKYTILFMATYILAANDGFLLHGLPVLVPIRLFISLETSIHVNTLKHHTVLIPTQDSVCSTVMNSFKPRRITLKCI